MPILLHHLLTESAKLNGSFSALAHKNNTTNYQELELLVYLQTLALQGLHLKKQQRVAVYLPKQIETVTSYLSISKAGGVFVPVNPVLKAEQVAHILIDCNVQILITSKSRLQGLIPVLESCPDLHTVILIEDEVPAIDSEVSQHILGWQDFLAHADHRYATIPSIIDADMAAILYTSGSTRKPKGVVLSRRNLITGAKSVGKYLNITAKDRLLAVLPFSFDYGLNQLTTTLLKGACCVLLDYLLPHDVITALESQKITGIAAVPPLWAQLANHEWPETINEHLRYMTNSGGKMPKSVLASIRQFADLFH